MTNGLLRRAFLAVPAVALAGVLLLHPTDERDTIYESVGPVVDDWITVHTALLFAFPLLALATALLLRGIGGRAARVARISLAFFAVFYTAWEVMVGLSTGILADYANGLSPAERAGAAGAIQDLNEHWITQVTLVLGSLGWIVAMIATAVAVRGVGARWPAVVLLGLASAFAVHPPPVGPVALLCFAAAAMLVPDVRARAARSKAEDVPDTAIVAR